MAVCYFQLSTRWDYFFSLPRILLTAKLSLTISQTKMMILFISFHFHPNCLSRCISLWMFPRMMNYSTQPKIRRDEKRILWRIAVVTSRFRDLLFINTYALCNISWNICHTGWRWICITFCPVQFYMIIWFSLIKCGLECRLEVLFLSRCWFVRYF